MKSAPKPAKKSAWTRRLALGLLVLAVAVLSTVLIVMLKGSSGSDRKSLPNTRDITKQSSSITYDPLRIDFAACEPGGGSTYSAFGSEHYLIEGRRGTVCVVHVGGETENPAWDGALTTMCKVPRSEGTQEFNKVRQRYCDNAPNN